MDVASSTTSTIAENDGEKKHRAHSERTFDDGGEAAEPMTPPMHDPNAPDLSFPFQSTNIEQGGFTEEYRVVSRTGYVSAQQALRPIPSHLPLQFPPAVTDPEKARELKNVKLVTFVPDDPQDPRNHPKWYKWCKYAWPSSLGIDIHRPLLFIGITFVCAFSVVEVAFASAVVTGDFRDIEHEFHVGNVVTALSVSLMVVGFGLGPLLWSPLVSLHITFHLPILLQLPTERNRRTSGNLDNTRNHICHLHHPLRRREEHPDSPHLPVLLRYICVFTINTRGRNDL